MSVYDPYVPYMHSIHLQCYGPCGRLGQMDEYYHCKKELIRVQLCKCNIYMWMFVQEA